MGRHRAGGQGSGLLSSAEEVVQGTLSERDIARNQLVQARNQLGNSIDPFRIITGTVVSFMFDHMEPLKKLLDYVTCTPEAVSGVAQQWEEAIPGKLDAATAEADAAASEVGQLWNGEGSEAFQQFFAERIDSIEGTKLACKAIGVGLDITKSLLETLRTLIVDQVSNFLTKMLENGLIRLVTWVFPPAGAAATAEFIVEWVARMYALTKKLTGFVQDVLGKLRALTDKLGALGKLVNAAATFKTAGALAAISPKSIDQVMGVDGGRRAVKGGWKIANYATTQIIHNANDGLGAAYDAITGSEEGSR